MGIFFPSPNVKNIEALIKEYFKFNGGDKSGSNDDQECSKEFVA